MKNSNWILEPGKYLTSDEAAKLLNVSRCRSKIAQARKCKVAVRDYFIVHLALATGLRVMEISELQCGDVFLDHAPSSILVRKGKGDKRRLVYISSQLKEHASKYLCWKRSVGESVSHEAPLIISSNTGRHMTTRAIQKSFKRCARNARLSTSYAIHCLRHTYACQLLKSSQWNMRLVQKQLGHARIETTQVYADVMMPEIKNALERMQY